MKKDCDYEFKKFCKLLGKRINKLRKQQKISIEELSNRTGIRTVYLKKIENGEAFGVKIDSHLLKIAEKLNIKAHELFDL